LTHINRATPQAMGADGRCLQMWMFLGRLRGLELLRGNMAQG